MELKRCPFCGWPVNLMDDFTIFGWHKDDCYFQFLERTEIDMAQEETNKAFIEAWNKRAQ